MEKTLAKLTGLKHKGSGKEKYAFRTVHVNLPPPSAVDIEFTNITLKVKEGFKRKNKLILKGVSGLFRSGELTAIMGPSGAGKSSLVNALTLFSTSGVSGRIRGGGNVCELGEKRQSTRALRSYKKKSCYILQDDRLNPLFTVAELMKFAADMKLGNAFTDELKMTVINEVLETLGLTGTEETRCGNLSGGQKKRLSIAVELIDNPPVVFLDEPTTGLDSLASAQCIELLKRLARSGRTIVCTIHQPTATIYSLFDQVYMLADGMCIYHGPSSNTVPYLASMGFQCPMYHNPADYILEIANGEYGKFNEVLAEKCVRHESSEKPAITMPSEDVLSLGKLSVIVKPPHEFYKFSVLFRRCVIQQYRDWTVTHLKVLLHIVIGVILGLLFEQAGSDGSKSVSNLGYFLVSIVYLCYTSLMPAVLRFPTELPVLKKENFNNWYNLRTYYAAVLVTGIPIQIWYSFVYAAPSYFLSGQPHEFSRFVMFVLVLASITLLADAIGNVIGTCVNPINGTFLGAITTCSMLAFAGFLVLHSHMTATMQLVSYVSFMKYAFEALVLSMYSYGRKPLPCPETKDYCHIRLKIVIITIIFGVGNLSQTGYYEILGVSKQATTQEIRQAYKKLAIKFHPDKNSDVEDQKKFIEITEAYDTLKDAEKRRKYDLYGSFPSYTRKYDYRSQTEYNNLFYNGLYHEDPNVETLSGRSFYNYLSDGFHFINFYSPFCPPCQNLVDHWKKLAELYKGIVKIGAVNCKYHNSFCYNSMRIGSYPSLLFYPNGKSGNFLYYRGERTLEALDKFLMSYISNHIHVPVVTQIKNSAASIAYVLGSKRIDNNALTRIAYVLKGLVTLVIVEDEDLRENLSKDEYTTVVFVSGQKGNKIEIKSTEEKEVLQDIVNALPKSEQVGPEKLKEIRNQLRSGYKKPWVLYFTSKDHDRLLFYQMRQKYPDMHFGEVDCERWQPLCASLQAGAWGALKAGGAYQRAEGSVADFLPHAVRATNLHTLSASDLYRILTGEYVGTWVLVVVPHQLPWTHVAHTFTRVSLQFLDSKDINFGMMSCTPATENVCREVATNDIVILMQTGKRRHEYSGQIDDDALVEFIQIVLHSEVIELDTNSVLEVLDPASRQHSWLVAFLPPHCRQCSALKHQYTRVGHKLRPLEFVRVGVLECKDAVTGICSNIRTPTARLYPLASGQHYTISLQQLSEAPYIWEWALGLIDESVQKLSWQTFTKRVISEDLNINSHKKPWLVYFHSPRCYRCYEMYADFAMAGIFLNNAVELGRVNCVSERSLCQHEQISSYPTLRLYTPRQRRAFSSVVNIKLDDYNRILKQIKAHLANDDDVAGLDIGVRSQGFHVKHDEF
ncbi:uncharacterized protein LOC128676307 [Plodia interpunctella]|uniref:uncharacterized protein LOC128676307 n=1 Tax=Plodia interpunctella TaxID=58824 RepID=UPI00236771A8|nr:uncharacterized protein LOC128676307 [Plodia interpunctella]